MRPPFKLGGKQFDDGLFAHAPSSVTFDLGGAWKTLDVSAGLQDGKGTKATFKILGDGRTLKLLTNAPGNKAHAMHVDVSGIHKLQLITEPPSSGNHSCWTLWANPTLTR